MAGATARGRGVWGGAATGVSAAIVLILAIALGLASGRDDAPAVDTAALVVDANEAPPGVLGALPRLGRTMVGRVVEARERAPFRSLADLDKRVKGVGPVTIEGLRPHLRFDAPEGANPGDERP